MGHMYRLFGRAGASERRTERVMAEAGLLDEIPSDDLIEIRVRGSSYYQDAFEGIAGQQTAEPKRVRVGVSLRHEPGNQFDPNAVRVEVMGQLLGYIQADIAKVMSAGLRSVGGVVEAHGIVVGGWADVDDERLYGLRVWLDTSLASRLGIDNQGGVPRLGSLPAPAAGEVRLSPSGENDDNYFVGPTVICEEHYQSAIERSRPDRHDREWWNLLVSFAIADRNPHRDTDGPCVELQYDGETVGFLTHKMSERYEDRIRTVLQSGSTPTAAAYVTTGERHGEQFWQIRVAVDPQIL